MADAGERTGDDAVARLGELVTRASWRLRRGTAKELEPIGITFAQARVLRTVGGAPESLRMADLAERLDVVPRSATSMIDALEAAGLVDRQPDPKDRRSVRLAITDAGRALIDRMHALRAAKAEELFGVLRDREQAQLARLLEHVLDDREGERR